MSDRKPINGQQRCGKILNFWLSNASLRLGSKKDGPNELKNRLRFSNPFYKGQQNNEQVGIAIRLFRIFLLLFTTYHVLKNAFSLFVEYKRDALFVNWRPIAKFNDSACDSFSSLRFARDEDKLKYANINYLNDLLRDIGDSFSTFTRGLPVQVFASHLIVVLCFFHYSIYECIQTDMRIDFLSFLVNPKGERARVRREIKLIFDDLLSSLNNTIVQGALKFDRNRRYELMYYKLYEANMAIPEGVSIKQTYLKMNAEMLDRLRAGDSIKPANLTDYWYSILHKHVDKALVTSFISNQMICSPTFLFYAFTELSLRVKQRLQQIECISTIDYQIPDYFDFSLTKLNAEQQKQYENYLTDQEPYYMLIWTELKIFLNFKISKSIFLHIISIYLITIWVSLYSTFHVFCHLDRIIWLNQIKAQIVGCKNEIKRIKTELNYQDKGFYETKRNWSLFRDVTVAYVNFELFRRSQMKFRQLASLFIFQGTMLSAVTMTSVYVVGNKLELNSKAVSLLLATYVVIIANFYLIFGSVLTSKIERIRNNILELIASCKENSLQYNYIMDLWSRQITSPSETRELLAPHFLGIYLSWGRLVTINVYLVALYWTLL